MSAHDPNDDDAPPELTVWQILWPSRGWDYATAEIAAMVNEIRPGEVRLASVPLRCGIDFERGLRATIAPVTRQKLAAARRALDRQVERAGLFGHLVRPGQPTPLERVEQYAIANYEHRREWRRGEAADWRRARRQLARLPERVRLETLYHWRVAGCPKTATYLFGHIRKHAITAGIDPATLEDRDGTTNDAQAGLVGGHEDVAAAAQAPADAAPAAGGAGGLLQVQAVDRGPGDAPLHRDAVPEGRAVG